MTEETYGISLIPRNPNSYLFYVSEYFIRQYVLLDVHYFLASAGVLCEYTANCLKYIYYWDAAGISISVSVATACKDKMY